MPILWMFKHGYFTLTVSPHEVRWPYRYARIHARELPQLSYVVAAREVLCGFTDHDDVAAREVLCGFTDHDDERKMGFCLAKPFWN